MRIAAASVMAAPNPTMVWKPPVSATSMTGSPAWLPAENTTSGSWDRSFFWSPVVTHTSADGLLQADASTSPSARKARTT